jgi:hypothetical protein
MKIYRSLPLAALIMFLNSSCTHQKNAQDNNPLLHSNNLKISSKEIKFEQLHKITPEVEIAYKGESSQEIYSAIGFALIPILNSIYGDSWKNFEGILFTALDGYKIDIPTTRILKYNPILAYRYKNPQSPFTYNSKGNEGVIELGPYYLVWDNIKNPELIKDGGYGWPYQIAEIETIRYASYYSKVFPFNKANSSIREGFEAFKKNCMACHALKDQGGQKGPQLWPYPPLKRFGREKFTQWVLSPQKLAPQTTMPALNPELSLRERKKLASKIYLYLAALHKSKK